MSSSLFEIMELSNGDIVLQRADDEGDPLVSIRFSAESMAFLRGNKFDVARAMIEAGMEAAGDIAEQSREDALVNVEVDTHQIH